MRVFLQEWKKIWRPGILVALLVLGLAYFYLFSNFYIEYFCNGPTAQAEFDLASEWVETYGPTMEPEERQALDQQLEEEKATFAQEIAGLWPSGCAGDHYLRCLCILLAGLLHCRARARRGGGYGNRAVFSIR